MTGPMSPLPPELLARATRIAAELPSPTPEQIAKTRILLAPAFAQLAQLAKAHKAA